MPNSLNTRLLRVTNEEENGQVITQIRPREYNHNISYGTTLSNSAGARINYDSLDSVSLKFLETVKEVQQSLWNICFKFKYNKKSKVFYNKI